MNKHQLFVPRFVTFSRLRLGWIWLIGITSILYASNSYAQGRYSELVLNFKEKKEIKISSDLRGNALLLEMKNTSPQELEALEHYDERLIKRILVKEFAGTGCELKIVLQDRNLKATVDLLDEPFRININIFDTDYALAKDPATGLPLAKLGEGQDPLLHEKITQNFYQYPPANQTGASASYLESARRMEPSPARMMEQPSKVEEKKHRLLQPTPDSYTDPKAFAQAIENIPQGRGAFWKEAPIYVYPLQTAPFQGRKDPSGWTKKLASDALSTPQAMADFALKLYSFGDENRAKVAYTQVLHEDSSIFEKDVLHLWAFAETHMGQGNLTLADGYYQTLIEKFPEAALAQTAAIRRLDIEAIRILQEKKVTELVPLAEHLKQIQASKSQEILALVAIREAFWLATKKSEGNPNELPLVSQETKKKLEEAITSLEGNKTYFLVASLLMKEILRPENEWTIASAKFAGEYFDRFTETSGDPYFVGLKSELEQKLSKILKESSANGNFIKTVETFESLSRKVQELSNEPSVAWAIGEAYRNLDSLEKAIAFYEIAERRSVHEVDRFKAQFWLSTLNTVLLNTQAESAEPINATKVASLSSRFDQAAGETWVKLKEEEKSPLRTAYKNYFEKTIVQPGKLKTPSKIVLESWTQALSTKIDITSGAQQEGDVGKIFSPNAQAVKLLQELSSKFRELGMQKERMDTIRLLKQMTPKNFKNDTQAKGIWTSELLGLAEELRQSNEYLEAGRLYTFTAEESENWEKRAEALYKGGLLLYRAGKREEALKAFNLAAQDGNNLFYANLAKERLSQMK